MIFKMTQGYITCNVCEGRGSVPVGLIGTKGCKACFSTGRRDVLVFIPIENLRKNKKCTCFNPPDPKLPPPKAWDHAHNCINYKDKPRKGSDELATTT